MGGVDYNDNNNGLLANHASKPNENLVQNGGSLLNLQGQQTQAKQPIMSNAQLGPSLTPTLSMPQTLPQPANNKPIGNFNIGTNFSVPNNSSASVY
jgi:hypothetical protein